SPVLNRNFLRVLPRLLLPLLVFIAVTVLAGVHKLDGFDLASEHMIQPLWSQVFAGVWFVVGTLGSAEISALLLLPVLCFLWRRDRTLALWLIGVFFAGNIIEVGVKHFMSHNGPPHFHNLPRIYLPDTYLLRRTLPTV